VKVHKERRRYIFGGCLAELTEVRADGKTTRTIAVESEDAARVTTAVRELGLESSPNTSYPRELKSLLGFA
jgi:exopolyphosphatase/guanosine-5'-triphosphate,3'-diphosphate pyrophosphatase